jgi:hypothetical protein
MAALTCRLTRLTAALSACLVIGLSLATGVEAKRLPRLKTETPVNSYFPSTAIATLKPLHNPKVINKLHFVVFGDNGSGLKGQWDVAQALDRHYLAKPFSLVLMTGDNIYPAGNVNQLGEARFNAPYRKLLSAGVAFKPVLGNHDYLGNFQSDQVKFYKMPSTYYTFEKKSVAFFALDTVRFTPAQAQWLDQALTKTKAPWKVVYGHYPIYSSGLHGSSKQLIKELLPLLVKHHVALYLCGHDHFYERFLPIGGVTEIISGGGGASLRGFGNPAQGSLVRKSIYHFISFEATPSTLQYGVFNTQNQVVDSGMLEKASDITQYQDKPTVEQSALPPQKPTTAFSVY